MASKQGMNVRVIDGGGRGHALAWAIAKSPLVSRVKLTPGNGGWKDSEGSVNSNELERTVELSIRNNDDLVVVGSEMNLAPPGHEKGLGDLYREAGIPAVAPTCAMAQIEADKDFGKEICKEMDIPTARSVTVTNYADAYEALMDDSSLYVVKGAGLLLGKGVEVSSNYIAAQRFAKGLFEQGSTKVVLEQELLGEEISFTALCDGEGFTMLPPARDAKRAFDGDKGPNTGGMGTFSEDGMVSPAQAFEIGELFVRRPMEYFKRRGMPYQGFLYPGLMMTKEGPKLLEWNGRPGDPETQVQMMRLAGADFVEYLMASTKLGGLKELPPLEVSPEAAVCVVLASEGYPGKYESGLRINGLHPRAVATFEKDGIQVFHAGTKFDGQFLLTAGGRVLNVVARGVSLEMARARVYGFIDTFAGWPNMQFRKDIAKPKVKQAA